jgi:hypothetical protein
MEVRDESLAVSGMLEIPIWACGSGWDEGAEQAIWLRVGNRPTVVDDCLGGCLDDVVTGAPRIKRELCAHQDFSELVKRLAKN